MNGHTKAAACLVAGLLLGASEAAAAPMACDLSQYRASTGLTARVEGEVLTVSWTGDDGAELRARYAVDQGQPIVRELAVRTRGGQWSTLGQNLTPEFKIHTGVRRPAMSQLTPLKPLGVDITSQAVIDREAWFAFWDAPFVIPGEGGVPKERPGVSNPAGPPHSAAEIRRVQASFNITGCSVKVDGGRLEINFPGMSAGIFSGGIRFTAYRGSNLLRLEAIASTQEKLVAYKYDAGLKGFSTAVLPQVRWFDTGGNPQNYQFGGARHEGPVAVRAKNRVLVAEGRGGSVAVFPPPTTFFHTREVDTNLGYVWYRKDADTQYGLGVKQADREDDERYFYNYALYNAPPGTQQRMATYFYLSPRNAEATRASVMAFTNNDVFKPIPGYQTMVNHFHIQFTDRLRDGGSLDTQTPDLAAMKTLGINIVGLSDFHADKLRANDTGELRLGDQHDYYQGTARASDKDFLVTPWEEPSAFLGAHYNLMTPRPLYWTKRRAEGQPFSEQHPKYGKVYHTGNVADVRQMLEAENAYWFHAHPRTKSTTGYPDAIMDKDWMKSDRYLGVAFKPGMGMDLSEDTLCEWRCFDAIDDMNNMYAGTGIQPKLIISDADTYQKWPHDDIFPGLPVNYIKLDRLPAQNEDWTPILSAVRKGDFFVTTGEVMIRNYKVEGTGNRRTIVADVDWTFPLEFLEVVTGDGKTVTRQRIPATDLAPLGTKRFSIPFDATGKKWVRFSVWDSAVNGAFVQPQWLDATPASSRGQP
jgi:hypothetical protein